MSNILRNQWVVITGASSGFGAAAAEGFARIGANVILGARREDRLSQVGETCLRSGAGKAVWRSLDVASTESVNSFAQWVGTQTEQVSVLVNNAGGAMGMETVALGRDEDWETMMQTNVLGVLRVTRAFLPLMTPHQYGHIINIGSVAGRTAYEGGAAYCAAKAGELQISRALRLELLTSNIRVSTIDPGLAETEFAMVRFKGDTVRAAKTYEGIVPLSADDVADAIVWVATRPSHVCIDEMVLKPTAQATVYKVNRKTQS